MNLEDLVVYQLAMKIAEEIFSFVIDWNKFNKWTIGIQLVKAADSIGANISEGFGRYFYKENKQFQYYARGSMSETKTWITKAKDRNLITTAQYEKISNELEILGKKHNSYINAIGENNQ